jgi:glycerol-3-phosphate dehydrogenase
MMATTAGCRPTIYAYGPYEDDLSREHLFFDHTQDGAPGLLVGDRRQARQLPDLGPGSALTASSRPSASVGPACSDPLYGLPGGEDHDLTVAKLAHPGKAS